MENSAGRPSRHASVQDRHYAELVRGRLPTRGWFSCGYAERFDPFLLDRKPFLVPVYEDIFARCFPSRVGTILDVGCGTGLYWPVLRRFCDRIVGVDSSAAMLEEAKRLIAHKGLEGIEVSEQDCGRIDLGAARFDAIVCIDALHHIPRLDAAIRRFHALLVPGGRLCAVEPNVLNPLIFLAHLIPPEERQAVGRSYGPLLRRRFAPCFTDIEVVHLNFVASAASARQLARVRAVDAVMSRIPGLRCLSLRQLLVMRARRDVSLSPV